MASNLHLQYTKSAMKKTHMANMRRARNETEMLLLKRFMFEILCCKNIVHPNIAIATAINRQYW